MKRSTERILVTHVGSLARPADLMEMLVARNEGKPYDREALAKRIWSAVAGLCKNKSSAASTSSTTANWENQISPVTHANG